MAKDVCDALEIINSRDAISDLDKEDKDDVAITDTIGRQQNTVIISESGLYTLVFKSRKSEARAFKKSTTCD